MQPIATEQDSTNRLDLHKAVFNNDVKNLSLLLESGKYEINEKDNFGELIC